MELSLNELATLTLMLQERVERKKETNASFASKYPHQVEGIRVLAKELERYIAVYEKCEKEYQRAYLRQHGNKKYAPAFFLQKYGEPL